MIVYSPDGDWLRVVFSCLGTTWPEIRKPFFIWAVLSLAYYVYAEEVHPPINKDSATILGSAMSFLLIFRSHQAYARYWEGRSCVSEFFAHLRDFMMMSCIHVHGGQSTMAWISGQPTLVGTLPDDEFDQRAREFRCNLARYTIAYAVVMKLYSRIALEGYCVGRISKETKWSVDWDRLRLRQLLNEEEFRMVDDSLQIKDEGFKKFSLAALTSAFRGRHESGPPSSWPDYFEVNLERKCRMHCVILFFLRKEVMRSANDFANTVPWGVKERFAPNLTDLLAKAQKSFDMINQIILTPIALPYACLCKTLCMIWMISNPVTLDHTLGFYGSYITSALIILALLGIDAISTELENPFGDDDNDLDLLEHINMLETEVLEFLDLCGDNKGRRNFVWRRVPAFVAGSSVKPIARHLAYGELAGEEVVASQSNTPASSHRSSDRLLDSGRNDSEASSRGK
mmetsp:Transcript_71272/g.204488  ORF Transcript_71272/g.204488 Transcript_71272/m.204488 type:complete len:456 (-) Transcript_71272:66-1433(-)